MVHFARVAALDGRLDPLQGEEMALSVARYLGADVRRFERTFENGFRIDPEEVARRVSSNTRLIVLTNLHNPSSAFAPNEGNTEIFPGDGHFSTLTPARLIGSYTPVPGGACPIACVTTSPQLDQSSPAFTVMRRIFEEGFATGDTGVVEGDTIVSIGAVGKVDVPRDATTIDGGGITAPNLAFYDLAGRWSVENEGVPPDIEVEYTPAEVNKGHDPQLERAVQEAMRLLEQNPVRRVPRPAPIDRVSKPRTR